MRNLAIAILLLLVSSSSVAGIYKCQNRSTGEIEFRDSPCSVEQAEKALPHSVSKLIGVGGEDDAVLLAIMDEDRERFRRVCEERIERQWMSDAEYERRCEAALRKQAQCKITASSMLPEKVHLAYIGALAEGLTQDEASRRAKSSPNWGPISTERAMMLAMPAADYSGECIGKIFD